VNRDLHRRALYSDDDDGRCDSDHYDNDSIIKVTGQFQQTAYMSITLQENIIISDIVGLSVHSDTILDYEMAMVDGQLNPYIVGNPSVMYYIAPEQSIESEHYHIDDTNHGGQNGGMDSKSLSWNHKGDNNQHEQHQHHRSNNNSNDSGNIPVYRVDRTSSTLFSTDDIADDGCSRCYLYAMKDTTRNDEMMILRMHLPTTFFDDYSPDEVFGTYQARYFSVSSAVVQSTSTNAVHHHHYHNNDPSSKSSLTATNKTSPWFYGVNTRLLKRYADSNGYFYVFFAPDDYTTNLAVEQGLGEDSLVPPVMTWGMYTGYVLGKKYYWIDVVCVRFCMDVTILLLSQF